MPNWAEKGHSQTFRNTSDFPTESNWDAGFSPCQMWPIVWSCGCKLEVDLTCWTEQLKVNQKSETEIQEIFQSDKVTKFRSMPVDFSPPHCLFLQNWPLWFPLWNSHTLAPADYSGSHQRYHVCGKLIWSTFIVKLIQPEKSIEFLFSRLELRALLHFHFFHFTASEPENFPPTLGYP